jgi:hypothetical protein
MKIIISENQLRTLLEQPESRFGPEQYMSSSERAAFHSGDANKAGAALAVSYTHLRAHETLS